MSTTSNARAKRWKTNPFIAEWFANTVKECSKPNVKAEFEKWLMKEVGPAKAKQLVTKDFKTPARKKTGSYTGNAHLFNSAAVELGVSESALQYMHSFAAEGSKFEPPRTKPAPKRRRGESSADWLARRHQALLEGCKLPDFNWIIARNIAISEYDKARDTLEAWRTDPDLFFALVVRRGPTALVHPSNMEKGKEDLCRLDMAYRAQIHQMTLSHMVWKTAAELFEDLARRDLVTPGTIEREFKKDSRLFWRLIACLSRIHYLLGHLLERLSESLSHCEAFRPYLIRNRDGGQTHVAINETYARNHPYKTLFDEVCIKHAQYDMMMSTGSKTFFDSFEDSLKSDPSQASKISQEAFDDMGNLAVVKEFQTHINESPFAKKLIDHAMAHDTMTDPVMLSESLIMNPKTMIMDGRTANDWCYARMLARSTGGTWLETTNRLTIKVFLESIGYNASTFQIPKMTPEQYDEVWRSNDFGLSWFCDQLDPPGKKGSVLEWFGIWGSADARRPSYVKELQRRRNASRIPIRIEPRKTPAPTPKKADADSTAIPVAAPTDSIVSSGVTYAKTEHSASKEKARTRKKVDKDEAPAMVVEETEDEEPVLPEALPEQYKLGKKTMKIFHAILSSPDDGYASSSDSGQAPKRGQAMKRVGFDVVQTSGSSVRFDPPATTVRPIAFHRPHPDSTMSPLFLKVVGARLKRTYGWTTETFTQGDGE